jgi:hypothetical protein
MENSFYAPTGEIWGIAEKSINEKQRTKQPENKRGDPSFAITTVGGQIGINDMRDKPIGMKHRPIAIKDDPLQFSAIAKCTKEGEYLAHFDVHHFMKMLGIGVRNHSPWSYSFANAHGTYLLNNLACSAVRHDSK